MINNINFKDFGYGLLELYVIFSDYTFEDVCGIFIWKKIMDIYLAIEILTFFFSLGIGSNYIHYHNLYNVAI